MSTVLTGQTTNTPLTPNSNATASSTGNPNADTNCVFYYNQTIALWAPSVSASFTSTKLAEDVGNAVVTLKAGLTVKYQPLSAGMYSVLVNGDIVDSGSVYTLTGKSLGTFPQAS